MKFMMCSPITGRCGDGQLLPATGGPDSSVFSSPLKYPPMADKSSYR